MDKVYTWLCLGDSYTIGEGVAIHENFPYQVLQQLRAAKWRIAAPEIIAKTGWTTDELESAMNSQLCLDHYDFVTLLIGVNNQYRGRAVENYHHQFEGLLRSAIKLANNKAGHVFVVSIPDYSVVPFAEQMDREKIRREIDLYNSVNRVISIQYKSHYIDITEGSRLAREDASLVAGDKLHPSGAEYKKWADKLAKEIRSEFS